MNEISKISESIETVPGKTPEDRPLNVLATMIPCYISIPSPPNLSNTYVQTKPTMPPPTHQRDSSRNDTLESLSALLTQLYTLHLSLPSPFPSSLKILQPPHSPSSSLVSVWKDARMSDAVIETLKRLPYLSSQGGKGNREIAPDTLALNYLDEDGDAVEVWRNPFCLSSNEIKGNSVDGEEKRQQQGYLGNAIPLTSCIGVEGCLLLLDLDSSTYSHPIFLLYSILLSFPFLLLHCSGHQQLKKQLGS